MIFYLSHSPQQSVQWLCDLHIRETSILTILKHESWAKWIMESTVNWEWTKDYLTAVSDEHLYRFRRPHKEDLMLNAVPEIQGLNYMTSIKCDIIPELCQIDPTISFRNWYARTYGTNQWTKRNAPIWIKETALAA